ncbi:MAG: imidazoleglycerol-phosphate dehydratase [Armatimonadota bacterium]|nr:imidazoleglycerol-phosphate dehydratase [Armatimonadota bacterium]
MSKDAPGVRYAEIERESGGTTVRVVLDLDGERQATVQTGVGFFDHLLGVFAYQGCFDLGVSTDGGLHVDDHMTLEDVGVCIGQAIRQALGEGDGIDVYGTEHAPVDEALARVVVDVSARPCLVFDVQFTVERIGEMSTEAVEEFFRAVANHAQITIHVHQLAGKSNHHITEAIFKAFGRALRKAVHKLDGKAKGRLG